MKSAGLIGLFQTVPGNRRSESKKLSDNVQCIHDNLRLQGDNKVLQNQLVTSRVEGKHKKQRGRKVTQIHSSGIIGPSISGCAGKRHTGIPARKA